MQKGGQELSQGMDDPMGHVLCSRTQMEHGKNLVERRVESAVKRLGEKSELSTTVNRCTQRTRRGSVDVRSSDGGDWNSWRLCQSSGELVFFLSHVYSLFCGSAFGAMAHDAAHDVFRTLPPYTRSREGEAPQLGRGPTPYQDGPWRAGRPSSKLERKEK